MAPDLFNVAVVGYGMSAKIFHIPLILHLPSEFKLYGIVQRSPKPGDDSTKDHPDAKSWRSVEEVYKDPKVHVVILTTTPETHYEMAKAALESGKHVVVEKPFVPSSREASDLIEIAKKNGKLLTVYQNRRWDTDYLTVCKVMAEGSLGDIVEFETHYDRYRPEVPQGTWKGEERPANGSIYDLGTHLLDQVYHSFGMPKRVTGFVGFQRQGPPKGPHDSFTVLLHYPNKLVTVKAAVISIEEEQLRFWIRGTKGTFKKFRLDTQEEQLKAGTHKPGDKGFGVDPESSYGTLTTIIDGQPLKKKYSTVDPPTYVEFYKIFAKALHGQGEVPVKPEDARDVLTIIETVLQSSKEGRTIELSA